ncbi:hypothetical protein TNCV_3258911 [Trichonephila clavipes]|nr:hypothetical protein TNCV_3258911 [Trichonephila clavipes]
MAQRFLEDQEVVKENERSDRSVTSRTNQNMEKIIEIMRKDRSLSVRMMPSVTNIDRETIRKMRAEN